MADKPRLLFVSPIMPALSDSGLAMRAGLFLDALASHHHVRLLVMPVADLAGTGVFNEFSVKRSAWRELLSPADYLDTEAALISRLANVDECAAALSRYHSPVISRFVAPRAVRAVDAALEGAPFDVVFVFRIYAYTWCRLSPTSPNVSQGRSVWSISMNRTPTATKRWRRCTERPASFPPPRSRRGRAEVFRVDASMVASIRQSERLFDFGGGANPCAGSVRGRVRDRERHPRQDRDRATAGIWRLFLSVRRLNGLPAKRGRGHVLLPRRLAGGPGRCGPEATLGLVGANPSPALRALGTGQGITVTGAIDNLDDVLQTSAAAVVPLRAGVGTRIKILDALSHQLPVVSTPIGAEGLNLKSGQHLIVAECPVAFASACALLFGDPEMRRRLAAQGRMAISRVHDPQMRKSRIEKVFAQVTEQRHN